jgi:hypothetical protein
MKKINVVVKKAFTDKYTGKKHKEGDRLTITDARFLEIRRSGDYVTVEKAAAKIERPEKVEKIEKAANEIKK